MQAAYHIGLEGLRAVDATNARFGVCTMHGYHLIFTPRRGAYRPEKAKPHPFFPAFTRYTRLYAG